MRRVIVHDKMQDGYVYVCTEPVGKNFHPDFRPDLNPQELLSLGVFGGRYLRDCRQEFPSSWFSHGRFHEEGIPGHSPALNCFGVDASQPLSVWRDKGWINHAHDPRGWFQWYCRYYMGRRLEDEDNRQIQRWKAMRRHLAQLTKHCSGKGDGCRKKQRQALLHWAYDTRDAHTRH
jgi:hypothetical protein